MATFQRVLDPIDENPERPFVIDLVGNRTFTFGQVHRLACALAGWLEELGIGRGDRVAILLDNSIEYAVLYFACMYRGIVAAPLNLILGKGDLEYIVELADAKALVYSEATWPLVPDACRRRQKTVFVRFGEAAGAPAGAWPDGHRSWSLAQAESVPAARPFEGVSPDDVFLFAFTSGTTSRPKGVPHTLASLLESALAFNHANEVSAESRFYHVLSMAYMAGFLNSLLVPFLAGAAVAIDRPFGARSVLRFWKAPMQHNLDTMWLPPTILSSLYRLDRDAAGLEYCRRNVRRIFVGTAALPCTLKQDFEARYGVELLESYGLSETLFVAANLPSVPQKLASAGKILPGVEVCVMDDKGKPVPTGQDGELCIRTPSLMKGYLDPQTHEPDPIDPRAWFPSGDIGHLDVDGYLFITGRKKDMIVRGGINISPRAVEDVLLQHAAVSDAAVVGIPDSFYGEDLLAVLELHKGADLEQIRPELVALCRKLLSSVAVPAKYVAVEELPRSLTGKVQKAELRERFTKRT